MELKNLTPHILDVQNAAGEIVKIPVSGPAPRLAVARIALGELEGFALVRSTMGDPEGLPAAEEGVILIVSALVAEAAQERDDLAYPGEAIRAADGKIVGARGLCAGPGLAAKLRSAQ